jgi:purine-binding chemotaxis protein CheW
MSELSQEQKHKILQDRARQLAVIPKQQQDDSHCIDITRFELHGENYAFESRYIREIVPVNHVTPLPCVPDFVAGIMNLRGRILSLLHLDKLLGLTTTASKTMQQVIILSNATMEFGVLIEQINGVALLPLTQIQNSLPTLSHNAQRYLRGLTADHQILLDAQLLLNDPALCVDEKIS